MAEGEHVRAGRRAPAAGIRPACRRGVALSAVVAAVVAVVVTAAACSSEQATSSTTTAEVPAPTRAIERTAAYFDTRPPRGDVGYLLGQGSRRLSPAFTKWSRALRPDPQVTRAMEEPTSVQYLEAILWKGRDREQRPWPTLPAPSVTASDRPSTLSDAELSDITKVMNQGLRCELLTPAQRQEWLGRLATPGHSYLLTHQMLSLVWGRDSGCLSDAEAEPLRRTLGTAISAELQADGLRVNDLSLERMAMLCHAGLCNWVAGTQANAVVTRQHADGSWGDGSVPINENASVPPEHTAGLGFYVLAMTWHEDTSPPRPPR